MLIWLLGVPVDGAQSFDGVEVGIGRDFDFK